MSINNDLAFFCLSSLSTKLMYEGAENFKAVLHFVSCDVTEMQRYAVIPAQKGTVEHPGAWAPVIVLRVTPAEFSIELA